MMIIAKEMDVKWFDLGGYNHFVGKEDQVYKINLFKRSFGGQFVFYPKKIYIKLNPLKYYVTLLLRKLYFSFIKLKGR